MIKIRRLLHENIVSDLKKKLVFLVGPRQVGKTWLAKTIMENYKNPLYLNYDKSEHREIIRKNLWTTETDLIVLDEIHKMKNWKNVVKGIYDTKRSDMHMLITGSAKLNAHKNIGDSLAGRFFLHHLFPFTFEELQNTESSSNFLNLFNKGGFPEPFISSGNDYKRWQDLYADSLMREDILNLESIENLNAVRNIYEILKTKIGSPVSYANIAADVGISPVTVKKYINLLETLYIIFIIRPHSKKISRSILKEPKIYFYDNGVIENEGLRFENLVAIALLAAVQKKRDLTGDKLKLSYLKTKEGHEIDFAIIENDKNILKVFEAKLSDEGVGKSLKYFVDKYDLHATQIVKNAGQDKMLSKNISIKTAQKSLSKISSLI